MAWIQKNNAPISKKIPFSLDRFDGGLNNKSSDTMLQNNQASDLLNMAFSDDGLMEKRHGVESMLNNSLTKPIVFLDTYQPIDSKPELLIATNEELYKGVRTGVDSVKEGVDLFNQGEYFNTIIDNGSLTIKSGKINDTGVTTTREYEFGGSGVNDFTFDWVSSGIVTSTNDYVEAYRMIELLDANNNVLVKWNEYGKEFKSSGGNWYCSIGLKIDVDGEQVYSDGYTSNIIHYFHGRESYIKRTGEVWSFYRRAGGSDPDEDAPLVQFNVNGNTSSIKKVRITFNYEYGSLNNLIFVGKATNEGRWLSPIFDVSPEVGSSYISWNGDVPLNTDINVKVNSSDDGQYWDGLQSVSGSGGTIPNKRFIQVEITLSCLNISDVPKLSNFILSYVNKDSKYDLTKLCDINSQINGVNYIGKYYFVDGNDYFVYDGIDVFKIVEPPQGFTPAPQPATNGKWYFRTTKSSSAYININLNMFNGGVLYDQSESKIWYEPCEEELNDNWKGINLLPKNPQYICVHKDRLFLSGSVDDPHNVYISDINNAYYIPVGLGIQLPPNGDMVNGLIVFHDSVVVSRYNDIHVIYGNTNRTDMMDMFLMRKVNTHTGFANYKVVQLVHNYLFYLGSDGNVYSMHTTQTNTELLATMILNKTVDLFKSPFNFTYDDFALASSIFYKDEYFLSIRDKVLVYSYRFQAWTVYDGIDARNFISYDNQLFMGSGYGSLFRFGEGYDDNGKPIVSYWKSKRFDMGESSVFKQFREMFIVVHTYDDFKSRVKVMFEVDYVDIVKTNTIESELSKWGEAVFGDKFNVYNILASFPIIIGQRGRVIRITFANGDKLKLTVATTNDLPFENVAIGDLAKVVANDTFYRYNGTSWDEEKKEDVLQPMKVYEINGEYEFRGRR